jgi:hypothetical protein
MALFGTKKIDDKPLMNTNSQAPPTSATRVTGAPGNAPAVGIDHAIMLMRQLPSD